MPLVTANWLARYTGKTWRTISRRIDKLAKDKRGCVDSIAAFDAIYYGTGNGEYISTPEAVRQLTIAKKAEIDLEMEIRRGDRVPVEQVRQKANEVFQAFAAIIKANRNRVLSETVINEIFESLRDWKNNPTG